MTELTHFSEAGRARMVDVSEKSGTVRLADGTTRRETFPKVPTYRYQLEAFCDSVLDGAPVSYWVGSG